MSKVLTFGIFTILAVCSQARSQISRNLERQRDSPDAETIEESLNYESVFEDQIDSVPARDSIAYGGETLIIAYTGFRFFRWESLDTTTQTRAKVLGYTQETWDVPGDADIEDKSFDDLTRLEQQAASSMGYDEDSWDCFQNHYADYSWGELAESELQETFVAIGYTEAVWENADSIPPPSDSMDWEDLSIQQQLAAGTVCYFKESWESENLALWDCYQNHYDDYTWEELEDVDVAKYYVALGWTERSWNGNENEPATEDKKWNDFSPEQQVAARKLCYFEREWNPMPYPEFRYHEWKYLDVGDNDAAIVLAYTENSWNNPGSALIENYTFDELTAVQLEAAKTLGFTDNVWDCYVNHYSEYDWSELSDADVQKFHIVLGWTQALWESNSGPATDDMEWSELSAAQSTAAKNLCFIEELWDDVELNKWDCSTDHFSEYSWVDLEAVNVRQYVTTLGWTEESWNEGQPVPATDEMEWGELTEDQRKAAGNICFSKVEWQGPYAAGPYLNSRYHIWDILESIEKAAAIALSYTKDTWNNPGTATIESKAFSKLDNTEKAAARALGFEEPVWNCYQNHYDDFGWLELDELDVQTHFVALGWTKESWTDPEDAPLSNGLQWADLASEESKAASEICYFQETWDIIDLNQWDCAANHFNDYTWMELFDKGVQDYLVALGWNEQSWDGFESPPVSETMYWKDLTVEQQHAARQICLSKNIWNGVPVHLPLRTTGNNTGMIVLTVLAVTLGSAMICVVGRKAGYSFPPISGKKNPVADPKAEFIENQAAEEA